MSQITIERADDFTLAVKRLHLPFILSGKCPECLMPWQMDLTVRYLSYPEVGTFTAGSSCQYCTQELKVQGVLDVSISDVSLVSVLPNEFDYTVIGVHAGEEVFEHVHCAREEAWNCAVRQKHGPDYPEDAHPRGYTGMCIAVLEGHQRDISDSE